MEGALRNDLATKQLLVAWRADVNLQARGSHLPLVFAVKQRDLRWLSVCWIFELIRRSVATLPCVIMRDHPRARWVRRTVKQLTEPGTDIAQVIDRSINEWHASDS